MNQTIPKILADARARAVLREPFWSCLLLHLEPKPAPEKFMGEDATAMATDGRSLFFDPVKLAKYTSEDVDFGLLHESAHVAFGHHLRRGSRDLKVWNDSGDHVVNLELAAAGYPLPSGVLADPAFSGLTVDAVYDRLDRAPKPDPEDGQDGRQPGNGDQGDGSSDGSGPGDQGDGNGAGNGPGEEFPGDVRDFPGDSGQTDAAAMATGEAERQTILRQAAQVARGRGKLPGALAELVESAGKPRISWRDYLAHLVSEAARDDYSWARPSRRMIDAGLYLPSLRSLTIGRLAVALDTSGSMSNEQLSEAAAEMGGLLAQFPGLTLDVIWADSAVQARQTFTAADLPLSFECPGRGGTDFAPVFALLAEDVPGPVALVYFSDLCGSFPESAPDFPVLWIRTVGNESAPFGVVIDIAE